MPEYYTCKVFRSEDGGTTWNEGAEARGGDKQWMTIDKSTGPGQGHIYSSWTSYYSSCYPEFFTRSTDGGNYFDYCCFPPVIHIGARWLWAVKANFMSPAQETGAVSLL